MAITSTQLQTTAANIVYGTSTQSKGITSIYLCNVSGAMATVNVFIVPSTVVADTANVANCRAYSNLAIASSDSSIADTERIILDAGDSIWANCSVNNAIVMTVSTVGL
jgi:hypothetical protein